MNPDQTTQILRDSRSAALLKYVSEGATLEDLEAAGYTTEEISLALKEPQETLGTTAKEFDRDRQGTVRQDTIESYTPTYRDKLRSGIEKGSSVLGGSKQTGQFLSDRLLGSKTSDEMGLLDLTGITAPLGIQEGSRQVRRGYNTGNKADMALGTLGAGLNALSAVPGGRVIAKGVTKGAEKLVGKLVAKKGLNQPPRAVIRSDNLFRGEGPITTSLSSATKPYAVRLTGQSQIDDMIKSGLVRPKVGGYGKSKKSTLYFGEMDEATPNSVFTRPTESSGKEYTIVAKAPQIAGREGPIPIDELQHIWTMRNGEMVDILPEVLKRNVDYTPAGFAQGGSVEDSQMERLMQEGGMADDGMEQEPVTGNDIPPGSLASEVRDDIDAKLSEGEYVVPADVVRFFGVRFFEDLRNQAKQGLSEMDADGRIGGAPVSPEGIPVGMGEEDDELTPEELQMLEEALGGMATGGMVAQKPAMGMQEGGSTGGFDRSTFTLSPDTTGGFESRKYINPQTKEEREFQFLDGQPLGAIPKGFVPWSEELTQETPETEAAAGEEEGALVNRRRRTNTSSPAVTSGTGDAGDTGEGSGGIDYQGWAEKNADSLKSDPYAFGVNALSDKTGKGLAQGLAVAGAATGNPLGLLGAAGVKAYNKGQNIAEAKAALQQMAKNGLDKTPQYQDLSSRINNAVDNLPGLQRFAVEQELVSTGNEYFKSANQEPAREASSSSSSSSSSSPSSPPPRRPGSFSTQGSSAQVAAARPSSGGGGADSGQAAAAIAQPKPVTTISGPAGMPITPKPLTAAQSGSDAREGRRATGGLVTKKNPVKAPKKGLGGKK